jgi:iron complex outermembrane receptor protein
MIQWHPGQYSYWTADNIRNVNSRGLESSVSLDYAGERLNYRLNAAYSFTRAETKGLKIENDMSIGKQLMYIPENQINASFRIGLNKIYSSWRANFIGKRYISVDNSKFLPEYFINNVGTGVKIPIKGASVDMSFNIDNLFDVIYQSIAYYPLPGRSYFLRIQVQLIK